MKERTLKDVEKDYTECCVKAGHIQYQISQLTEQLEILNYKMFSLNEEANNLDKKEEKSNE